MTRRKNHRRTRRKHDVQEPFDQSSRELSSFALDKSDDNIEGDDLNFTLKIDQEKPDLNLGSPETVMCNTLHQIDSLRYKELSPEIITKIPKIKLDNDIPDCDAEQILEIEPNTKLDMTLDNLVSQIHTCTVTPPKLESVQPEPIDMKLDNYALDKTVSINSTIKMEMEVQSTKWSDKYDNTAECFPRFNTPVTFWPSGEANCETGDKSDERRDIHDSQQHYISGKHTPPGPKSRSNHLMNRRFTFGDSQTHNQPVASENTEEIHWYGRTKIFPSLEQLKILKAVYKPQASVPPKYNNEKPTSIYSSNDTACRSTNRDIIDEINRSRSSSPPAKKSRTALRFENETDPKSVPPMRHPQFFNFTNRKTISPLKDDNEYARSLKSRWSSSSCSPASVELPTVSDIDGKASGSEIESQVLCEYPHPECIHCAELKTPPVVRVQVLTIPFAKITEFCSWLAKKIVEILRKGCAWLRESMSVNVHRSAGYPDLIVNELAQLVTTIKCENEHTVSILSEKVTHLSEELLQVRVRSEAALAALTTEVTGMREASTNLVQNNTALSEQLKSLHNVLDNIHSKPSLPTSLQPPPPPPPPPPPLPPALLASSQLITPTTPNSSRSIKTPTRKCSTPLQQSRPTITVEDLLKVTLKKAPLSSKENKHMAATPRGPTVSLDMLRSVKLRSARRRSCDQKLRSPRSTSLSMRSRPPPSLSLSPIMSGTDNSLGRILRQVDNKRGSKRALSSPTHSEAQLLKDSPRTFSVGGDDKIDNTSVVKTDKSYDKYISAPNDA